MEEFKIIGNKFYINKNLSDIKRENIIQSIEIAKKYKLFHYDGIVQLKNDPDYRPFNCEICDHPMKMWAIYEHKTSKKRIKIGNNCSKRILYIQYHIKKRYRSM